MNFLIEILLAVLALAILAVIGFSIYWVCVTMHHRWKVRKIITKPTRKQANYIVEILNNWKSEASINKKKIIGDRWVESDAMQDPHDGKLWFVMKDQGKQMAFIPIGLKSIVCVKGDSKSETSEAIMLPLIQSFKVRIIIATMVNQKRKKIDQNKLSEFDKKLYELYTESIE